MIRSVCQNMTIAAVLGGVSWVAPAASASGKGQIIAANYGSANLPAAMGRLVCPEAPGLDGMPVHFETELASPGSPGDFVVRGADGHPRPVVCVTLEPSDDDGEQRSILLIGEFGSLQDQPVSVEVVGDLLSRDSSINYRGASASFIPLEAPPALILAEVVPEAEWDLGAKGTRIPWGGGTGCPEKTTVQVLRVSWGGGIRAANGHEAGPEEWGRYTVALRGDDGKVSLAKPFAVGDLNDNDNNHELCLAQAGTPVEVRFPAGYLFDPNGDVNKDTTIKVSGSNPE